MKIDLGWIQKELDAGREVKLEGEDGCYINEDNYVLNIDGDDLVVSYGTGKLWISSDNFKHFRIKQTPTFKDLVGAAVQAVEDGLIIINCLTDWQLQFVRGGDTRYIVSHDSRRIKKEIDFINSLYTETFVIESEEDLKGLFTVDENMTITTVNGSVFRFGDFGNLIMLSTSTLFKLIKGATVTRKIP